MALGAAHARGETDPWTYAGVLEQLGRGTSYRRLESHWLLAAAKVWERSLSDTAQAQRLMRLAVERDPQGSETLTRLTDV